MYMYEYGIVLSKLSKSTRAVKTVSPLHAEVHRYSRQVMAEASELLISPTASAEAIENALAAVIRDGKSADFAKAFGHRRLLKALAQGTLSEQAQELADELLSATDGGVANSLANGMDFSEVLHREELHPDVRVDCSTPSVWWPGKDEAEEAK